MIQSEIENLLEKTIGLKAGSIGKNSIKRAINERMKSLDEMEPSSYLELVRRKPGELHELVEEVVVPETWFFRDHYPFAAMVDHLLIHWDRSSALRILSLPCSTGEEPYSIAMALLDAGIGKDLFRIDGVDISKRSLQKAKTGEYTRNSFRSKDLAFRDRFFHKDGNKYLISDEIRRKVNFIHGNILNIPFVDSLGVYDIVFSRNILIYFDQPVQNRVIAGLDRILKTGGLLFTGHAETSLFIHTDFYPMEFKKAFGLVKRRELDGRPAAAPWYPVQDPVRKEQGRTGLTGDAGKRNISATAELSLFEKAKKLSDQGDLNAAEAICMRLLEDREPSAELFFQLGIIKDNQGKVSDAVDFLRKAVYLDPQHYESLIFLSLLAQRTGDDAAARNYRRRAGRIVRETDQD